MNYEPQELIRQKLIEFDELVKYKYPLHIFDIDCSKIPKAEEFDFDNRKKGILGNLFTTLEKIETPCLYWFECENVEEAGKAKNDLEKFRDRKSERNIPAKNNINNSTYLYVGIRQGGKRKRDGFSYIAGRIYIHLGYYKEGSTQGLQLVYWTKSAIKLSVIELPTDMNPYLNIIEKFYAISLKPVIGKH
jgi:hypothetical protein